MPNKLVTFIHLTGSAKSIPGIKPLDCAPKLKMITKFNPSSQATIPGFERNSYPVFGPDEQHKPSFILLDEDYQPISDQDKKSPKAVRDRLEQAAADDVLNRRRVNADVMNIINKLEQAGEIKVVSIKEMTPEEVVHSPSPFVDMSDVMRADYEARKIPIPPEFENSAKVNVEKSRAQAKLRNT